MAQQRYASTRGRRAAVTLGEHVRTWRKLQGLTAQQVAERAGINRTTLSRLENGEGTVRLDAFIEVARALGQLDRLVEALDPYDTDFGRARADEALPLRVRS